MSYAGITAFLRFGPMTSNGRSPDLKCPAETNPHLEALAAVLDAIWSKAEQFGNDINVKAEEADCNWAGRR